MAEAEKVGTVRGLGDIYKVAGSLNTQIEAFENIGIQYPYLVDTSEVAQIRLANVQGVWTRTSVAPVARKGEKTILIRPSPLMNLTMATIAVQTNRDNKYLEIPGIYDIVKEIAKSQEGLEPENRTAIILSQSREFKLTPEMPDTQFLLKQFTRNYFAKFGHKSIQMYNLQTNREDTVNYLWFGGPQGGSLVDLGVRGWGNDCDAFGVLRKTAAGSSKF